MDAANLADLAQVAALDAARQILDTTTDAIRIAATKSSPTDMVTETDQAVERGIVETLTEAYPDATILAEERGRLAGSGPLTWVIDPIDGTTNFVYGLAGFNISIAAALHGEVVAGVVVDPVRAETFRAVRGQGATCNGAPIHSSDQSHVTHALVGTGFSYDSERRRAQAQVISHLIGDIRDIRRLGAAALDLCYVACGRLDAYFESGLKPWDLAAGQLIATEAGAHLGGLTRPTPDGQLVIAAAPGIFDDFATLLAAAHDEGLAVEDPSAQPGWKAGRLEAWEPASSLSKTTNESAPR